MKAKPRPIVKFSIGGETRYAEVRGTGDGGPQIGPCYLLTDGFGPIQVKHATVCKLPYAARELADQRALAACKDAKERELMESEIEDRKRLEEIEELESELEEVRDDERRILDRLRDLEA